MDYIILYNPLSKSGSNEKIYNKIRKKFEKKGFTVLVSSLIEIIDVKEYIDNLLPKTKVIIIGGDGTLHHLANTLMGYDIKNDIYAYKAGTGNDFLRSLKKKEKLVRINDYIHDIPYDIAEQEDNQKRYFLNSVGMGIDAYIAYLVNTQSKNKGTWSYFKNTYKGFTRFKPEDLTITIDGVKRDFKKTWLAVVANSAYLGKGMKISPKSKRLDDKLEVVVVHGICKFLLFLIFPLTYLGWHIYLKKWVKSYEGKEIIVESKNAVYVQYDGETEYPRRQVKAFR